MPPDRRAFILDPFLQPQEVLLRRLFRPAAALTILDAGACEGESALRYARLFPNARVVAVEPLSGNLARIRANIEEFGTARVEAVEACLSDREGSAEFPVSAGVPLRHQDQSIDWDIGNNSSSLLAPGQTLTVHPWPEFPEAVTVATCRLDSLAAELGVAHLDFLHLDVQGAELLVLDGAGALLPRIHTLWLEVESVPPYEGQPLREEIEVYLRERGFAKLYDSVDDVSGDQFWAQERWLTRYWGRMWVVRQRVRSGLRRLRWLRDAVLAARTARSRLRDLPRRLWRLRHTPPPEAVKRQVLREYARAYRLRTFVGTGTYLGDTVEALRGDVDRVYSIELSEALHAEARERFAGVQNVELIKGDSGPELARLLPRLTVPALFWLDGHYSGGVTARGDNDTPIMQELRHILTAPDLGHVIVIDDARCFGHDEGYPTIREVRRLVCRLRPGLDVRIGGNSVRITPRAGSHPLGAVRVLSQNAG